MAWVYSAAEPQALADAACSFVPDLQVERRSDGPFRGTFHAVGLTRSTLCRVNMRNARVSSAQRGFLSAWMLLRGDAQASAGSRRLPVGDGSVILAPGPCALTLEADAADILIVAFSDDYVEAAATQLNGSAGSLASPRAVSSDDMWGASFRRQLKFVWNEAFQATPGILTSDLVMRAHEDSLLTSLMLADGNDSTVAPAADVRPPWLQTAERHIAYNINEPLNVADLSRIAGVSASTLSRAFRRHHGCGPIAFAKRRRLERAQLDLKLADPQDSTVTDIATSYGFYHLAQFAADYRKAFGEKPSETLRRA